MKSYNFVTIFLLVFMMFLFIMAIIWEIKDINRVAKMKEVKEVDDPKEKERLYLFYSTFPYENTVTWRMLFISAFSAALLLFFALNYSGFKITARTALVIFFVIFFVYYYFDNFKSYHFWRVLASKTQPRSIL